MREHDCDVLIVGGGPTGITLALLLARRGVRVIVAEKEAAEATWLEASEAYEAAVR